MLQCPTHKLSLIWLLNIPSAAGPDEHVYHPGTAEPGVHENHTRRLLTDLANDSCLFLSFDFVRGLKGDRRHSFYEIFRSSLSAIQTLIMD